MSSQNLPEQAIREQAAEWVVLQSAGPLTTDQQQALEQWCASDARHAQAYAFAQATWADLGQLTSVAAPAAARARPARARRPRLRAAVASAAVLFLAVFTVYQGPAWLLDWRADYATATGEVRRVTLADGSLIELDSRSAVQIAFNDQERRIRLLAGEAVLPRRLSAQPSRGHLSSNTPAPRRAPWAPAS